LSALPQKMLIKPRCHSAATVSSRQIFAKLLGAFFSPLNQLPFSSPMPRNLPTAAAAGFFI
jgi:hypothetical protein